jgi:hypothetical protein
LAYGDVINAVNGSDNELRAFREVGGVLPTDTEEQRKFPDDLWAIRRDLTTLQRDLPGGKSYDVWNQLTDYANDSDAIAAMDCPE